VTPHRVLAALVVLLAVRSARAGECTHDSAVQSMGVLQSVIDAGDHFGFPTLPTDVADLGPEAGIPYIETVPDDTLGMMAKSVLAALHQSEYVHYALLNHCVAPLSDDERATAKHLMDQFDPWIAAWADALPKERQRRATDKAAAALICEVSQNLEATKADMAREKSNTSGVVDVVRLHDDGQDPRRRKPLLTPRNLDPRQHRVAEQPPDSSREVGHRCSPPWSLADVWSLTAFAHVEVEHPRQPHSVLATR
jgi:hypothetical protein